MLIANESQWRTEDLVALAERIQQIPGFTLENFYYRTLLLFKTSRLKEKTLRYSSGNEEKERPPAASVTAWDRIKHEDARVIEIRSPSKIQLEVLDRLANSDVQQDMSKDDVLLVAKCIGQCLAGWKAHRYDYSWAREMPLRIGGPPKRSAVALEREIRALRNEQERIRRDSRAAIEKIEKKIQKVQSRKVVD